jgi:hypothetical protein
MLLALVVGYGPPGFTHCKVAEPPEDVKNAPVTTLANPAALKVAVRLLLAFFTIVGVPIKCVILMIPILLKIGELRLLFCVLIKVVEIIITFYAKMQCSYHKIKSRFFTINNN